MRMLIGCLALMTGVSVAAQTLTLEQVMRAPFSTSLTAAPHGDTFAWVSNQEGRRNVWIATVGQPAKQLTHYAEDDGQEVDEPAFSPDGGVIVYTRGGPGGSSEHPVPNPAHLLPDVAQQIYFVSTKGDSEPVLLAQGHAPAVSPRSDLVAYLRNGQIWVRTLSSAMGAGSQSCHAESNDAAVTTNMHGSTQRTHCGSTQLLQMRGRQGNLRWSPDGNALAFVSSRGDHSLIAIYRFDTKQVVFADPGTSQDSEPVWSPDSKQVAFIRNPTDVDKYENRWAHEGYPWAIRVADARSGEGRQLWQAQKGVGSLFAEIPSRDNLVWTHESRPGAHDERIVFPWERDGWKHLYSIAVAGGEPKLLTPGAFEIEHVTYMPKRNAVVISSNERSTSERDIDLRHLWMVPVDGSAKPKAITQGDGVEVWPAVSADGVIATLHSTATTPVVPAVVREKKLVDVAPQLVPEDFPANKLVTPQQVIFHAADGLKIHGQLFLPREGKQQRHPAIVFIHGGSRRQMYLAWHPMEYYSNTYAMNQYLCSLGYVVLSVNYRSGIGYGMLFRQADHYGFDGASEYNDVLGAARYLQGRADVDAQRIGLYGGSYGGYLTALGLARNSDVFRAGVDYHGVHDWVSEMGLDRNSDASTANRVAHREEMARTAWLSSPMAALDTWQSPVLLVQGDDDRNVQFAQTVRLANELRKRGVHVEEKVFPDEVHDFLLHRDWITTYRLTAEFFHRELASQ
ncbi:MAG: S9 family peptidase [Acidobacteria bacterium]|nr:S9 family peptidase [Acidobacteriota bacterium]